MIMLLDELPAFIEGTVVLPDGSTHISHYHLTMNKDDNAQWSAGYLHYDSGRIILAVNDADNLDEIAIRLRGRLERWIKKYPVEPGMLQTLPKNTTLTHTNLTEDNNMSAEATPGESKPQATVAEDIQAQISQNNTTINAVVAIAATCKPPVVQEVVLAQRHLEDATDRLERALKLVNAGGGAN
jgi:hypothetical protein